MISQINEKFLCILTCIMNLFFMVTCHFIWYGDNDVISYIAQ